MDKKLGIAVIGCGRISFMHLDALMCLDDIAKVVAVVDRKEDKAFRKAKEYNVDKYYTNYASALKDAEIEAVVICVPNDLHFRLVLEAAKAGKHILVEKPMAMNLNEADKMIEEAEKNGINLMVGQSRRFFNVVQESKKRLREIGSPFSITYIYGVYNPKPATDWWKSTKKTGGLVIPLNGSHAVDYILWLVERDPIRIYSEKSKINDVWEGEDEAIINMTFGEGIMANIYLSFNMDPPNHQWFIIGPDGTLHIKQTPIKGLIGDDESEFWCKGKKIISGGQLPNNFTLQMKEFIESILENRVPLSSGFENRRVIKTLDLIRKSAALHQTIEFG